MPDPKIIANAGSFFKNPVIDLQHYEQLRLQHPQLVAYPQPSGQVKIAAGWLIDQAGWKGKRIGNVGMYEKQALVLVNYATASLQDVQRLSQAVQQDVFSKFAVQLEAEPVLVSF